MKPLALILALSVLSALGQQYVQEPKTYTYTLTGEAWLTVHRINEAKDPDQWHPSMTVVTSTYKPVVTKHGNIYEITFRTVGLPEPDISK